MTALKEAVAAFVTVAAVLATALAIGAWVEPTKATQPTTARRSCNVADELCSRVTELEAVCHPDPFVGDSLTPTERQIKISKLTTAAYALVGEYREAKEHEEAVNGRSKPQPISEEP